MAIDVQIQDERGVALAQYEGPPLGLPFLKLASPGSSCFRFIVPWGDATFNQEQIAVLLHELQDAAKNTSHPERLNELTSLIKFAEGASGVHVYLKFIGD
jgi:hypothetical protein